MQKEKNYFPALTGIRAIAAWMVFIHHFNPFNEKVFGKTINLFFSEMHVGVTFFFVLSGLLLTLRYYDKSLSGGRDIYNYFVKRAARILPAYFLILTISFLWGNAGGNSDHPYQNDWIVYLLSFTFITGYSYELSHAILPHIWSISVEESFYMICPVLFYFIRRQIKAIFILPIFFIGIGILLTLFFRAHPFFGFFSDLRFLFNFTFFGRCIEFIAGIATGLIFMKRKKTAGSNKMPFTYTGLIVITACIFTLSLLHTNVAYGDHHPFGIVINNLLLPVFGISIFYFGLLTETTFISKFLSYPFMVEFGKSSYIFYLIHLTVITYFISSYISGNPLIIFVILNIISVILYRLFEHPVNLQVRKTFLKSNQKDLPAGRV